MIRSIKSDDPAIVGMHCFEKAGLGIAPFKVTGFSTMKYQGSPDAPVQPGGTCDYCGTAIMYVCHIRDNHGHTFKVGSDCVNRTGDAGLIKTYKNTPAYRAHQKALRDAKDARNQIEIEHILHTEELANKIATQIRLNGRGQEESVLSQAERSLPWCGAKGRAEWLATFRKILAQ